MVSHSYFARTRLAHTRLARVATSSIALVACIGVACKSNANGNASDSAAGESAPSSAADTAPSVRGTVASLSASDLVVTTGTGSVSIKMAEPFQVYDREPGTLADVTNNTFVGVTSVKQPDGTEQATEIHIFPDALRGLGEGSRMMTQSATAGGAPAGSRMTNGTATTDGGSRMSNGTVSSTNGTSIVVQYAGGSQSIVVPANTPVTRIAPSSTPLAVGNNVVVLAKKQSDGSLSANAALIASR